MEVWLQKDIRGSLIAADEMARVALRKLKLRRAGTVRDPSAAKRRHASEVLAPHHDRVGQATGQWDSPEDLLVELKVKLGIVREVVIRSTGEVVKVPGSHQLCAHDPSSFDQFFERALRELCLIAAASTAMHCARRCLRNLRHESS